MSNICRRCKNRIYKDTEGSFTTVEGDTTEQEHMECPNENPWERDIRNLVAFCVLMEPNEGILGKSPDYIWEKFREYVIEGTEDRWKLGLDANNEAKIKKWIERWQK